MQENCLTELTKIRKFVFADLKNSGNVKLLEAYNNYWIELENNFLKLERVDLMEQFFVDFLTIQNNGIIPKRDELMNDFVKFYTGASKFQSKELVLRNLYKYSVYFLKISFADVNDFEIKAKIDEINSEGAKDAYPFLMEVFEDYDYAHINKKMLLEILDTVIGFIYDRNSLKPSQIALSFAGLSNEINKMMVLKDYVPKFKVDKKDYTINNIVNQKG